MVFIQRLLMLICWYLHICKFSLYNLDQFYLIIGNKNMGHFRNTTIRRLLIMTSWSKEKVQCQKSYRKKIITWSRKGENSGVKKKKKRIQKQCKKIEKQCKKDLGGLIERQGKRPNPSPGSHMSLSHNALDADAGKYQETTFQNRRRWKK